MNKTDLNNVFVKVFGVKPQESEKELFRKLGSIPLNIKRTDSKLLIEKGINLNLIKPSRQRGLKTIAYQLRE